MVSSSLRRGFNGAEENVSRTDLRQPGTKADSDMDNGHAGGTRVAHGRFRFERWQFVKTPSLTRAASVLNHEFTPPTTEEIRSARPLAMVLPQDALTHAMLITATLCADTEDDRALS